MTPARLLGAAALALSLAACGTTVPLGQAGTTLQGDGLGQGAPGFAAPGAPLEAGSAPAPGEVGEQRPIAGGAAPGGTPDAAAAPGAAPTTPTATAPAGAAVRTPLRVGVLYAEGVDEAATALGITGLTTGDTRAQSQAVFDWVNAHGGLGGRKLVPVYHAVDAADSANNPEQAYQQACTSLVQDGKVRFVFTIYNLRPSSMPCFAKGGVGVIADQAGIGDADIAKHADLFAAPGDFSPGRMVRNLVDDLWSRGWLTKDSTVGSYTTDTPGNRAIVDGALTEALRAHGLTIASKQRVSNDSGSISQASSVALQFRSAGVDRVIPIYASPLFVMQAASSQGYRPAYALYSSFGPGALLEGAAPRDQLTGAAGIGWQPYLDIGAGTKPGPVSSNETLCFDIMRKAGQASTAATVRGFQLQVCNTAFYLKAATDLLPSVPADLLSASRPLIGAGFRPADTFRTDVTRRPDGAAGFRSLAFQEQCSCFQYVSPVQTAR